MPSRRYLVSGWGRGHSGNTTAFNLGVGISFWDAAQAYISNTDLDLTATGQSNTYTRHTGVVAAPSNAAFASVYAVHYGTASTQAWTYWDDFECYLADNDVNAAGGNVVIVDGGMTIKNGALTLEDEYGHSSAVASGFTGDWADFIANGLYNSRFLHGIAGTVASGRTASLPYWKNTPTSATLTYATGEIKATWSALAGACVLESDLVPVQPYQWYSASWAYEMSRVAGSLKVQPFAYWYDAAGSYLSYSSLASQESAVSVSAREGPQDGCQAPSGARYVSVYFSLHQLTTHDSGNWTKLFSVSLRPIQQVVTSSRLADDSVVYVTPTGTYARFMSAQDMDVVSLIQSACTAAVTIYGLRRPSFGKRSVTLLNYSGFTITIKHESASATNADERFATPGSVDFVISDHGSAVLFYNDIDSRWYIVAK